MKRSQINAAIRRMEELAKKHCFSLPPFCSWTPLQWQDKGHEYDEIRNTMLGWDITDYGEGRFEQLGFTLITIRNGKLNSKYKKTYAEKMMMIEETQYSPMHFHWNKMEDIINRGGGNVLLRVYNSSEDETFADTPVTIHSDGRCYVVAPGTSAVLLGEVSMCNDDDTDNRFYEKLGRFPELEEDDAPYRLLCTEYPPAKKID